MIDSLILYMSNNYWMILCLCSGTVTLSVSIMPSTQEFEICENDTLVVSGLVYTAQGDFLDSDLYPEVKAMRDQKKVTDYKLGKAEVYKLLRLRGYDYGPTFQGVSSCSQTGMC